MERRKFWNKGGLILLVLSMIASSNFMGCSSNSDNNPSPSGTTTTTYSGILQKSNASVQTTATGTISATFNSANNELSYSVNWSNLTSGIVGMHFHDGVPIIHEILGAATTQTGTNSGKLTLTSSQPSDLAGGRIYIQIHTQNNPNGEVIGSLTKTGSNPNPNPGY